MPTVVQPVEKKKSPISCDPNRSSHPNALLRCLYWSSSLGALAFSAFATVCLRLSRPGSKTNGHALVWLVHPLSRLQKKRDDFDLGLGLDQLLLILCGDEIRAVAMRDHQPFYCQKSQTQHCSLVLLLTKKTETVAVHFAVVAVAGLMTQNHVVHAVVPVESSILQLQQ